MKRKRPEPVTKAPGIGRQMMPPACFGALTVAPRQTSAVDPVASVGPLLGRFTERRFEVRNDVCPPDAERWRTAGGPPLFRHLEGTKSSVSKAKPSAHFLLTVYACHQKNTTHRTVSGRDGRQSQRRVALTDERSRRNERTGTDLCWRTPGS